MPGAFAGGWTSGACNRGFAKRVTKFVYRQTIRFSARASSAMQRRDSWLVMFPSGFVTRLDIGLRAHSALLALVNIRPIFSGGTRLVLGFGARVGSARRAAVVIKGVASAAFETAQSLGARAPASIRQQISPLAIAQSALWRVIAPLIKTNSAGSSTFSGVVQRRVRNLVYEAWNVYMQTRIYKLVKRNR